MNHTLKFLSLALLAVACVAQVSVAEKVKSIGEIESLDPSFDKLIKKGAVIEVLAEGFEWSEGPVWVPEGKYVLFSDIPNNRIVKWKEGEGDSVFLEPSGYTGKEKFTGGEPGTNGLMIDSDGNLVMCCHGDRMIVKLVDGKREVLVDKYDGKRLNSPNDLIFHSNGQLYFTDPPYGLPKRYEDPARELDWCGVYRLNKQGKPELLTKEMTRPNGIAFSPDEKTLYVAQSDGNAAVIKRFRVKKDGTLGKGKVMFDATKWVGKRPGLPDGMVVDTEGNIWATGPGGVLVFNAEGKLIGRLNTGEKTANCTFGPDGVLYITADMYFCRVRTTSTGLAFKK